MSKAYDFYNIGDYDISENNNLMAYSMIHFQEEFTK